MSAANPDKKKTRHPSAHELDISISFLEGIVRRDPEYVDALKVLGDDYTRRGSFEAGLQVDARLAQLRPDDSGVQYNLACSLSLTGQIEAAAAALEKALDLGYDHFSWLSRDPDLKNLRAHPIYKTIRARIKQLQKPPA